MPESSENSLSVVVTQDHRQRQWRVTWYVLAPHGQLLVDGERVFDTDMVDGGELDAAVADLYGDLLKLL